MAIDRTNMVSLLDIGLLMNGAESNIVELGDGFNELTEDWGPKTDSTQYVNMKSASNTVKGYEFSMNAEREYLSDDVQKAVDDLFKNFPTGTACNTFYYRYLKTDMKETAGGLSGEAIKLPVTVCPSSTGGSGGDTLTSSIQINGNGDAKKGTLTISSGGEITFA